MPTPVSVAQNYGRWDIEAEADLSSAGAVTAVRGDNITCTKTGTGTYSFVVKGTSSLMMFEVLNRSADLSGAPATAFWAKVTSVTQNLTTFDITIAVTTLNNAATPAATDTTAACVLEMSAVIRYARMGNPFP